MRRCRVFASSVEGWPDFATWEVKMRLIDFACASANPSTASTSSWIRRPPSRQTRRCSAARASARRQAPHASSSTAVLALPTSTCADVDALHHRHPHLPPRMLMALLPMTSRAWPREPRLPTLAIASQTNDAQFQWPVLRLDEQIDRRVDSSPYWHRCVLPLSLFLSKNPYFASCDHDCARLHVHLQYLRDECGVVPRALHGRHGEDDTPV